MARLTGPLMSLGASGTIAKTLTYGDWKGISYARTRVIPANPNTSEQQLTRDVFRFLPQVYKFDPTIAREPWIAAVTGVPMTPINMILSKNTGVLRDALDLDLMVLSPGARGGIPPASIVSTPGSGQLSVAVTAPSIPSGWSIVAAQGVVLRDQDPHDDLIAAPVAVEDTSAPYTLVFTGLTGGQVYQIGVWLKWLTPNQDNAYSVALRDQDTPS